MSYPHSVYETINTHSHPLVCLSSASQFFVWFRSVYMNYFSFLLILMVTYWKYVMSTIYSDILIYIQKDAALHSIFYLETALHVSGCTITHNGVRHPQHTHTGSSSSTIAADSNNGVTNTRCCRYSCLLS